ncbi:MAG: CZB domain-containing protein [Gammaproteobacteria bacterium]|nr:CZB domain-containing protein [Gammaproteobacteria bacterium]
MNLDDAIQAHAQWKIKFRGAISAKDQMDAVKISADNCCPLGIWLHGEAKSKYSHLNTYKDVVQKHSVFHKEAGKVASAINAKKYSEATAMLDAGTPYMSASLATGVAISVLKKEVDL